MLSVFGGSGARGRVRASESWSCCPDSGGLGTMPKLWPDIVPLSWASVCSSFFAELSAAEWFQYFQCKLTDELNGTPFAMIFQGAFDSRQGTEKRLYKGKRWFFQALQFVLCATRGFQGGYIPLKQMVIWRHWRQAIQRGRAERKNKAKEEIWWVHLESSRISRFQGEKDVKPRIRMDHDPWYKFQVGHGWFQGDWNYLPLPTLKEVPKVSQEVTPEVEDAWGRLMGCVCFEDLWS